MFAKRFFYVSASILMLAAAYHLGAGRAVAQAVGIDAVGIQEHDGIVAVAVGRTLYVMQPPNNGGGHYQTGIPGTARVVGCEVYNYSIIYLVLENGDVYATGPGGGYFGNVLGGATPTETQSFGALKAKYR